MNVIITDKKGYHSRDGSSFPFGTIAEFDDHLAVKLIGYGIAGPAPAPEPATKASAKVETADVAPSENTAKRTSKPKARRSSTPAKKG